MSTGRDVDLGRPVVFVDAIPAIDIGALDGDAGQAFDLRDLAGERVPVIGATQLAAAKKLTLSCGWMGYSRATSYRHPAPETASPLYPASGSASLHLHPEMAAACIIH